MRRFLPLLLCIPCSAQEGDDPLEGHSAHGEAFNEGPRQAAYLLDTQANVSFPVTAKSEEVQRFFDQGVSFLHGFWYFEAERTFRQVLALDPDSTEVLATGLSGEEVYPFPIASDAELELFRSWRAFDNFEQVPLHGTYLIDSAGRVRWLDISYEPFMDWEFLLAESARLLGLPEPSASISRASPVEATGGGASREE